MRIQNSYAAAVAAAVAAVLFSAAMQPVEASFIYYAEQSGSNVVITGSGSINTSTLPGPFGPFGNSNAIQATTVQLTTGTPVGTVSNVWTNALVISPTPPALSTLSASQPAASSSGPQMTFQSNNALWLPASYVSGSDFTTTAVFANITLADFGWELGAGTYASPNFVRTYNLTNGETIKVGVVPEPTQLVSVAAVGAMFGAWRLRKLRRARTAEGEAVAG